MRGNSQLVQSVDLHLSEAENMNTSVIILLTNDNRLEDLVADALSDIGGVSHLTRDAGMR